MIKRILVITVVWIAHCLIGVISALILTYLTKQILLWLIQTLGCSVSKEFLIASDAEFFCAYVALVIIADKKLNFMNRIGIAISRKLGCELQIEQPTRVRSK